LYNLPLYNLPRRETPHQHSGQIRDQQRARVVRPQSGWAMPSTVIAIAIRPVLE